MKQAVSVLLAAICLGIAGCGAQKPAEPVELIVSAAASLTDCMDELKFLYETAHPQVRIQCNYGSSGALQQQIEQGAPADLFFSAGQKQMDALTDAALVQADTVSVLLENKVVLIVPKNAAPPADFAGLADAGYERIGVGEPQSVPVGAYTAQIFETLSLTDTLAKKLVYAKDVREVLSWVQTGNVDAGIVYETDAMIGQGVQIACAAPADSHDSVRYPAGIISASTHPKEAKDFLAFLQSDAANEVYQSYGFTPVQ